MSARPIVLLACALVAVLALPAAAGANPAVSVSVLTTSNLSRLPASVTHRLTLTAGAQAETVGIAGSALLTVGGNAEIIEPARATGGGLTACPGQWARRHEARSLTSAAVGIRIPAGGTAWVDQTARLTAAPWLSEDLDGAFTITPSDGTPYTIVSGAPTYTGPIAPEMSLRILRAAGRRTVIAGEAGGAGSGRLEIWGYAPRRTRAAHIATVGVAADGTWSFAGWQPTRAGRWELYTRYRRTARSHVSGATECGALIDVRSR